MYCLTVGNDHRHTVPNAINASSIANVPFLARMNVLNDTATIEMKRKMLDIMMIARGKPCGVISLAEGSTPFEGVAILKIDWE
jgi:hypothetical protein